MRHGGVGVVVAEVARLSMTASRRLTLAAEASGSMAIAIRRWRRQSEAASFGQLDGVDDALAGVGRPVCAASGAGSGARPLVARTNRGESADFVVSACNGGVISIDLASWSTDRLRCRLGAAAPDVAVPLYWSDGLDGGRKSFPPTSPRCRRSPCRHVRHEGAGADQGTGHPPRGSGCGRRSARASCGMNAALFADRCRRRSGRSIDRRDGRQPPPWRRERYADGNRIASGSRRHKRADGGNAGRGTCRSAVRGPPHAGSLRRGGHREDRGSADHRASASARHGSRPTEARL